MTRNTSLHWDRAMSAKLYTADHSCWPPDGVCSHLRVGWQAFDKVLEMSPYIVIRKGHMPAFSSTKNLENGLFDYQCFVRHLFAFGVRLLLRPTN